MREHASGWIVFDKTDEEQAAHGSGHVDGAEAAIGTLRTDSFAEVTDQDDRAGVTLRNIAESAKNGAYFVGALHIDICAEECLDGIDDERMYLVFCDGTFDTLIRKCQRRVAVVDH